MYNLLLTHTYLPLCEGGTCIHTTVNPTSLCCAILYPLSRPLAYCMVRREAWRLYLRTSFFFLPFPCLEQIEEVEGTYVFCSVSVPEKKRGSDRHGATFANDVLFFSFSAHAALQRTRGRLETCLCEGRREERKGEGGCLMDHGGLSGC